MTDLPSPARASLTPEIVVFDLGKVLVDFDYHLAARRIAARGGKMSPDEVQAFIDHSPLLFRFETGGMTKEAFFEAVCAATGFRGTLEEFAGFFSDIFTPIEPMVEVHARLRQRGVPTFIFSNTNELAAGHIRRSFPFFSRFDGYVLSYEHGVMKPDPRFCEVLERVTGRAGPQIFFLDDRVENAAAGAARGWQVVQHRSPPESIAVLQQVGLLPLRSGAVR
jgi:FMN phosphatase YigB (HAD superfamily)